MRDEAINQAIERNIDEFERAVMLWAANSPVAPNLNELSEKKKQLIDILKHFVDVLEDQDTTIRRLTQRNDELNQAVIRLQESNLTIQEMWNTTCQELIKQKDRYIEKFEKGSDPFDNVE